MEFLGKRQRVANPKDKANLFSDVLFLYTLPLFKLGFRKELKEIDIYDVSASLKARDLRNIFEEKWQNFKQTGKKLYILRVLATCYGAYYFLLGFGILVAKLVAVNMQLYAVGKLVAYFELNSQQTKKDAYIFASVIILMILFQCLYTQNYLVKLAALKIRVRVAICSLIYRKALKIAETEIKNISIGKVVTLITKDVATFETFLDNGNEIWMGIFKGLVTCCILYARIGVPSLVPMLSFVIFTPIQVYLALKVAELKREMFKQTDRRLQTTSEVLSAIRVIKTYTWETIFRKKVSKLREQEMHYTYKIFLYKFIMAAISAFDVYIAFVPLMALYKYLGNKITAEIVYFTLSCYRFLSYPLAVHIPRAIYDTANALIAIGRIDHFLTTIEIQPYPEVKVSAPQISFDKVSIRTEDSLLFYNVNLKLVSGLTAFTGPVGAGKTILLKTILQEYQPAEGKIIAHGTISYASQTPWLFSSSIRQNITFGQHFNEKRYREVLRVCSLDYDLRQFQEGDQTIVESYGMNLSRGQQMRINLARAVYRDSQIYLLDDCLASLDPAVSNFILSECFHKFLRDKMVIFVTNDQRLLEKCTNVVVVSDRNLSYYGSNEYHDNNIPRIVNSSVNHEDIFDSEYEANECETTKLLSVEPPLRNIYEEIQNNGQVKFKVYGDYAKSGGGYFFCLFIICTYALVQGSVSYLNKSVSVWANVEEKISNFTNLTNIIEKEETFGKLTQTITIHGIVMILLVFLTLLSGAVLFYFAKKVSILLHQRMIESVIGASLKFFDQHFTGNILNRFSRDLNVIDEVLPFAFDNILNTFFILVGAILLIIIGNTIFLVPTFILFFLFVGLRILYLATGRNLKRLEASTKSPVVGHLSSTLEGLTTVRVFKVENLLQEEFDAHQDLYSSTSFLYQCTFQAFALSLELICWLLITIIIIKFLISDKDAQAADVGLTIFQALTLRLYLSPGICQWTEIENQITSVERIMDYVNTKQETNQGMVLKKWTHPVVIKFENVCLSYDGSVKILQNISFVAKAQEKVAIVGRTGSGKSSLVSVLARFYSFNGKVIADGLDIEILSLNFLRSNISFVPQEPIIFSGTVRENIDPEGLYTDSDISKVIQKVNLTQIIPNLDQEISYKLSSGQKQLICLARALLRDNKIVVLDEVTAGVDLETEVLINNIIRENFKTCVLLMVTHHLESALMCDKVLVLERGTIVEFDNPSVLLQEKSSLFYKMFQKTH